ncbi:unnamed protein product [Ilex paraguariensis]|uniref:ENTH domain-containing protein n=1 Tax=Ilex paraguariensis TaxID=185542 RepID=A0ABC8T2W5_9AQUA
MAPRKRLRELIGILKDKASLIKATLSTKRTACSIHVAVLRATTHASTAPPPEHRIAAVLSHGHSSRPTACACIEAIMDRLHNTSNAFVAMKCLMILHNIITRGSFILKDQLSFYPTAGGRNFLNLSRFRDKNDVVTWEFSWWVRWYAGVLERNLMITRVLGSYFSVSSSVKIDLDKVKDSLSSLLNSDLLRELDSLVGMVEEICRAPESLNYQQNALVYEIMRLVSEDYRSTQYQIMIRLSEFGDRIDGLSSSESAELNCCLKRLLDSKEKLVGLFANKKRNDAFWDLINHTKMQIQKLEEERERGRMLLGMARKDGISESTRFGERVIGPSQFDSLLTYGRNRLGEDRVHPTVRMAMS